VLTVALLVGAVAAFSYTAKLKLTRPPVGVPRFDRWLSPDCGCPQERASLSFRLRKPQQTDVEIVDADGDRVRVLATGERLPRGRVEYEWDGRDDSGAVVPDGPYRVRVRLLDDRRITVIPTEVRVDTRPPLVEGVRVRPGSVAAGAKVTIRFRTNEPGTPVVLVDGDEGVRGPRDRRGSRPGVRRVVWIPKAAGTYQVAVSMIDRAGNISPPSAAVQLTVADSR
jgi:FlgD Ig-like domain